MGEAKRADIIILLLDLTSSELRIKATSGTGKIDKKKLISQSILFSQVHPDSIMVTYVPYSLTNSQMFLLRLGFP